MSNKTNELSKLDFLTMQVENFNNLQDDIFHDGIHCDKCKDKGYIQKTDGETTYLVECSCKKPRMTLKKLKSQGLGQLLDSCTFDRFEQNTPFQKAIYNKAIEYVNQNGEKWFVILGQTGCGKTHLCTAIVNCLVKKKHKEVNFIRWNEFIQEVNANVNNPTIFYPLMDFAQNCEVLYIDDFLKPLGEGSLPTTPELKRAFEIIDYRGFNHKQTIISGERNISDLISIDAATAGRIYQNSQDFLIDIAADLSKNYRFKGIKTY